VDPELGEGEMRVRHHATRLEGGGVGRISDI